MHARQVAHGSSWAQAPQRRAPAFAATKVSTRQLKLQVCRAQTVKDLPANLAKIVGLFQIVPDPMARYKQLLFYATKLEPLPEEDHVSANKVEGCVSQVWVKPELRDDGKLYWKADSDSQLTKGLAALLVIGLSGCTPEEILRTEPGFIEMLGLKQSLTPSRNNGFLNMFRLMQRKAATMAAGTAAVAAAAEGKQASAATSSSSNGSTAPAPAPAPAAAPAAASAAHTSSSGKPVQDGMRRKITEALKPSRLVIEDQSAQHAGHAHMMSLPGKAGSGETHFKVEIVSAEFEGMNLVKRQRLVYGLLQEEFGKGLHALSLDTKTPAEVHA